MGNTFHTFLIAASDHDACRKVLVDKRYHASVTYGVGQLSLSAWRGLPCQEAFKVKGHAVCIALGDIFLRPFQCLVAASMGAGAKAVVAELAFIDGTQYLADGLLD